MGGGSKRPGWPRPGMGGRCARACLILAIGIAMLGVGVLAGRAQDEGSAGAVSRVAAGRDREVAPEDLARSILAGKTEAALTRLGAGELPPEELPPAFASQFFSLAGYARVMGDGSGLVGFASAGNAGELFEVLREEMEQKGWLYTPLGVGFAGTFTKESGVFRWAFLACYPLGEEACAVLQYR